MYNKLIIRLDGFVLPSLSGVPTVLLLGSGKRFRLYGRMRGFQR